MQINVFVDWLSFTLPGHHESGEDRKAMLDLVMRSVRRNLGHLWPTVTDAQEFEWAGGRAPYLYRVLRKDHGVSILFDRRRPEILIEMTGLGCQTAWARHDLVELMATVNASVTRVDLTADLLTAISPGAFVGEGYSQRFKSVSSMVSESGETWYIGSWKSDRFARVYRYAPPHPRADKLRVEHVFRDNAATVCCQTIAREGFLKTMAMVGATFQWQHPAWAEAHFDTAERLVTARDPKSSRDSVHWVYSQVVPALTRLLVSGRLDWSEFLGTMYNNLIAEGYSPLDGDAMAEDSK